MLNEGFVLEKMETHQCVLLVCVVNPSKDSAYISKLVSETFRYSLTLFLNTRECENERRLKAECQNLLLVARKLFSRLGEFICRVHYTECLKKLL